MSITTADCKNAIIKWIHHPDNINYFKNDDTTPLKLDIKRISKKKTKSGKWLREFTIKNNGYVCYNLYAIENCDGTIEVLVDDPDAKEFMEGYGDRIFPQQ